MKLQEPQSTTEPVIKIQGTSGLRAGSVTPWAGGTRSRCRWPTGVGSEKRQQGVAERAYPFSAQARLEIKSNQQIHSHSNPIPGQQSLPCLPNFPHRTLPSTPLTHHQTKLNIRPLPLLIFSPVSSQPSPSLRRKSLACPFFVLLFSRGPSSLLLHRFLQFHNL